MKRHRWSIDAPIGGVTFVATSSVHAIRARGSATGWIEAALDGTRFAPATEVHGRLGIPLAGLRSGNPLVDNEMRRRIDPSINPCIVAEIETTEETDGEAAKITGTIEFLGIDVLVEGDMTLLPGPRLSGIGEFDVRWWGFEPPRLFTISVDPIVTVEIDLPLV